MPVRQFTEKEIEELKEFDKTPCKVGAMFHLVERRRPFYTTIIKTCKNHICMHVVSYKGKHKHRRHTRLTLSSELCNYLIIKGWPVERTNP